MVECEKKVLLSENEFLFLRDHRYPNGIRSIQSNHYYDNDRFDLNCQGITCRIREKEGMYTATIKEKQRKWSEYSIENSRRAKSSCDTELFSNMDVKVSYQGFLTTERITYTPCRFLSVMLDKNIYLGTVDYELEIEYEPNYEDLAVEELENIIRDLHINQLISAPKEFRARINSGINKSSRFFNQKAAIILSGGNTNEFNNK